MKSTEILSSQPSLEEVKEAFEKWRGERKSKRTPIPEELWKKAAGLTAIHSMCQIAHSLRLSYSDLKKRISPTESKRHTPKGNKTSFVEIHPLPELSDGECIMEMENGKGLKLKISFKKNSTAYLERIMHSFWEGRA
jgi:hypothetical protein